MTFYIQRDGQPKEFAISALIEMVKNGTLRSDEYVFDGRTQKWVGATQVAELATAWRDKQSSGAHQAPNAGAATPAMAYLPMTQRTSSFRVTSWRTENPTSR